MVLFELGEALCSLVPLLEESQAGGGPELGPSA